MSKGAAAETVNLETIVDAIPDLMFIVDGEGRFLNVFAKGKEHLLCSPQDRFLGGSLHDIFDAAQAAFFIDALKRAIRSGKENSIEYPLQIKGRELYFEARIVPLSSRQKNAADAKLLVIVREVTQKHDQEQKARLVEKVFEDATEGILIENSDRYVVKVNPAMRKMLEMKEGEIVGRHSSFFKPMFSEEVVRELYEGMETSGFWHGEAELTLPSGKRKLTWVSINAVLDSEGGVSNYLVMVTDISEVRTSREQLEFMASHDLLTGLPNRALLFDHLAHAVASIKRRGGMGALLFMDLDGFKGVNDHFGHHIGDQLLVEVSQRLTDAIRASDTVGRLGGDEFLMIAENVSHVDEVLVIVQKIRALFAMPFLLEDVELDVSLSIGIALIPDDGDDAETLVGAADQAMYAVKARGRNGFEFYSKRFSLLSHEYFRIQRLIVQAIRQEAFEMLYQPQYILEDGRLSGVEALLRCTLEAAEDIPVSKLISVAEESGTINDISRYVLNTVCAQIARWRPLGDAPVRIAMNLSRRELECDTLVETVAGTMRMYDVTPLELEFEITESMLMQGGKSVRNNIEALREMGCRFSIDDFGTGYSSLRNLKEFDLDKLKIDRVFIDALSSDENDRVIVSATISMAKKLGLTVLAEGVERAEQAELLREYGCDEVQGYFYSEAVDAEAMTALLVKHGAKSD